MCRIEFPQKFPVYHELLPGLENLVLQQDDMIPCYCRYYPHQKIAADEKILYCCHEIILKDAEQVTSYFEFKLPKGVRKVIGISGNSSRADSSQDIDQKLVLHFNSGKDLGGVYYTSSKNVNQTMPILGSYAPVNMPVVSGAYVQGWIKDLGFIPDSLFPYTFTIILACIAKRKYTSDERSC